MFFDFFNIYLYFFFSREETLKELQVQYNIPKHENVVELIGFVAVPVCIVLEYCENGSLRTYILSHDISFVQVWKWLKDIASGVNHCHLNNVIHRDLATRNVLLDSNLVAKVSDFGMSRIAERTDNQGITSSSIGPVKWVSNFFFCGISKNFFFRCLPKLF